MLEQGIREKQRYGMPFLTHSLLAALAVFRVNQTPGLEDKDEEQKKVPIIKGEMVSDLLYCLTHKNL